MHPETARNLSRLMAPQLEYIGTHYPEHLRQPHASKFPTRAIADAHDHARDERRRAYLASLVPAEGEPHPSAHGYFAILPRTRAVRAGGRDLIFDRPIPSLLAPRPEVHSLCTTNERLVREAKRREEEARLARLRGKR